MTRPLVYVVAGEPSGDLLGARLIAGLKALCEGQVDFAGIGGEAMREQGLTSLFPQKELAVMGLMEVLPRIPAILRRLGETVADVEARQPAAIVTIDSWGFTGRLTGTLAKRGHKAPRIHYVAPMVWAWKERRAQQLAGRVDLLMCLLPNEPPYFEKVGLKAVHVGHPVLEGGADKGDGPAFRHRHGIGAETPLLSVLPGSRHSETSRLLPVFAETVALMARDFPGLSVVVPTVETVATEVTNAVAAWPVPVRVVTGATERYDAMAASGAALAASGTVALELAMAKVPMVIAYRLAPLTAYAAKKLLKIRHVCLLNLLAPTPYVPEMLQENCRPESLASVLAPLLSEGSARAAQLSGHEQALAALGQGVSQPSLRAAEEVLRLMKGA